MKSSKFGFVVLATVLGSTAAFMGACSSDDSSSSGKKNTGGSSSGDGGNGGQGGDSTSGTGAKSSGTGANSGTGASGGEGGGAGSGGVDKCDGVTCSNDGDPCTEDVCNPADGTCGIPRTGTACNDGIYCNGTDKCDDGECTDHAGMPCVAGQACNEDQDACECDGPEDCPATEYGAWSTPTYDTVCDETGAQSRTVTTYACVSGMCDATVTSENGSEVRDTDGTTCPDDATFCNGVSKCSGGSCVPTGINPCSGSTPFCRESTDVCWVCENDQPDGTADDGCTSGAPNCCNNSCGTATCGIVVNTLTNNIVLNNVVTTITNQIVLN